MPQPAPSAPPPATRAVSLLRRPWPELASLGSGALLALCYAPWNFGGLVWIWSFPLLAALWFSEPRVRKGRRAPRWRHGFRLGYLAGFAFFAISLSWITEISRVAGTAWAGLGALMGLALYLGLYVAAFGAFAATAGRWSPDDSLGPDSRAGQLFGPSLAALRTAFLNGAAWCGLEWLRGILLTGFGWNGLGVALKEQLALVQFAEVIGVTGYGFVLMFCGTVLFCVLVRVSSELRARRRLRPHLDLAVAAALVAGLFLHGLGVLLRDPGETVELRARVLQLNIPLEEKWSPDLEVRQKVVFDYRDLTRLFVEASPHDLVIWPETALPGIFSAPWVQEFLNDHVLKGGDFHLLAGLEEANLEDTEIYNTITLMQGDTSSHQMYKKVHLVPFGEFIPLRGRFPLFEWIAGGIIERDFTRGDSYEPLVLEKDDREIGLVPLVCFEDTVPRHVRRFLRPGPQVLVNVTNDGWFYDSAEPQQHFDNALLRCIEFRRPMVRAANTGVSGFVDERGSVHDRTGGESGPRILRDPETGSTYLRGSLPGTVRVPVDPTTTLYARFGDAFSVGMGLLALAAAGIAMRRPRRPRPGP